MSEALRVFVVSHAAVLPINQEPFDALGRAGAQVTVAAPRVLRTDLRGLVRIEALPGFTGTLRPLTAVLGGYRPALGGQRGIHLIVYRGIAHALRDVRPDVIFVEEEPFSLAAGQVVREATRMRVPVVIHENQNIVRRLPLPFERIRRWVFARAAGVTVRSAAAEDAVRALGFTGPVERFPHAVDPARFGRSQRRTDLPRPVVGFVGRLVPEKGILDLIDALGRMPEPASLLVIGDGPARAQAERRAASLRVRFTGPLAHEDVPGWYASMDVVAVPSRTTPTWMEQFGRIVIEANAAGVPVVVSDSGELPMTVAATAGGVVVPEGDVDALARTLAGLCRDAIERRRLGEAGLAGVTERFTPQAVATRLLGFLREVAT